MGRLGSASLRILLVLASGLTALGCEDPSSGEVTTSSVTSLPAPLCQRMQTDTVPRVVVQGGGAATAEEEWLGSVDHGALLPGGGFVIGDQMRRLVHIFDEDGARVRSVGGPGQGPGELQLVAGVLVLGDSILVPDAALRRLTIFERDGSLVDTRLVPGGATGAWRPFGVLSSRVLLYRAGAGRDSLVVGRLDLDGNPLGELGAFPASEYVAETSPGFSVALIPFGRQTSVAALGDYALVATGEGVYVSLFGADGEELRLAVPDQSLDVTDDMLERLLRDRFETTSDTAAMARLLAGTERPDRTPPYIQVFTDAVGGIWLEVPDPGVSRPRYVVLWPTGSTADSVFLSRRHEFLAADGTRLLTRVRDDLGVHSLELFDRSCDQSSEP